VRENTFIVAIDGPAGAGKSSTSMAVAKNLKLAYVDTGAIYRTVALAAIRSKINLDDEAGLQVLAETAVVESFDDGRRFRLNGKEVTSDIRTPEVGEVASRISVFTGVRKALIGIQRAAARPPGAVVEGRDIGTVIFPNADLKVFLDADPQERARRRSLERGSVKKGDLERTAAQIATRDRRDSSRQDSPLQIAGGAMVIDTTGLGLDDVVGIITEKAQRGLNCA